MSVGPAFQAILLALARGGRVGLALPGDLNYNTIPTAGRMPVVFSPDNAVVVADVGPNHVALRCGGERAMPYILLLLEPTQVKTMIDPGGAAVRTLYRMFTGKVL